MSTNTISLADLLAAPFAANEIKWKPKIVKGNRVLAIADPDARLVEDRLDAVFGPGAGRTVTRCCRPVT